MKLHLMITVPKIILDNKKFEQETSASVCDWLKTIMGRPQTPAGPISVSAAPARLRLRALEFSLTRVSRGADGRTRNGKMAADGGRAALPCAFSPKSQQFLALCAQDGRLRIWNTDSKTLQQEYVPSAHLSAACTCVTWGPCRAVQVTHSVRGTVGGCGLLYRSTPLHGLLVALMEYLFFM